MTWLSKSLPSLTRRYISTIHRAAPNTTSTNDFTHCVVGGGVVGLAVAARLSRIPDTTTILLERHDMVGTETSSRNSEVWFYVVTAGEYYTEEAQGWSTFIGDPRRNILPAKLAQNTALHRGCKVAI